MSYIKARRDELKNVTWPTWKQATHQMAVVLVFMLLTGIVLGVVDYALKLGVLELFDVLNAG